MAFTTELVLAAQTGPGVEYLDVATTARAGSGSYGTVGSQSVGAGQWLVAWTAPLIGYSTAYVGVDINLAGSVIEIKAPSGGGVGISSATTLGHSTVVTGPSTVTVQVRGTGVAAGRLRIARIG